MNNILSFPKKMVRFESSWLIFVKALMLNDINTNEFCTIICKPRFKVSPSIFHWWESHQVDVLALTKILGLPKTTIDEGFIDRLILSKYCARSVKVRHCPMCIEHNYHSPFFQITWLVNCPWHHVALEECSACSSFLNGRSIDKIKSGVSVPNCIHIAKLLVSMFPLVTLSEEVLKSMIQWSEATVIWLRAAHALNLEDTWDLMSHLPSLDLNKNFFLYFRFIEKEIGAATFDVPAPYCEVKYVLVNSLSKCECDLQVDHSDKQDLESALRSLRRYFYKSYIRSHKKCFNAMRQLDVMQCSKLDLTVCCGCVIAYFSWLMSYNSCFRIAEVTGKANPILDDEDLLDAELQHWNKHEILKMAYIKFYDIWAALELYVERLPRCSILVVYKNQIRKKFLNPTNFTFFSRQSLDAPQGSIRCYFVADDFLQQRNILRCSRRNNKNLVVADLEYHPDYNAVGIAPSRVFVLADRTKPYKTIGYINI
ncbi:hypothetical protein [Pseudomonas sp.]|uniref:hypothetical protein n=1 Tax=Pseudomonas sp. TaxID=306 RepID=UPI003F342F88